MAQAAVKSTKKKSRLTRRQAYLKRLAVLKSERSTWDTHWRECADYMAPRRFRKNLSDANRGTQKNNKILNGEALLAVRTLAAGMMAGITSPSRPWMRLTLADQELAEIQSVKEWTHTCTERLLVQLARTNFYNTASSSTYVDLSVFGTHCTLVLPDRDTRVRFYPVPLGQFWLASSAKGIIDTVFREFTMTVGQLEEEFGFDALPFSVQKLYNEEKYDQKVSVLHVIEPNRQYEAGRAGPRGMRWASAWMVSENPEDKSAGILREGGHRMFPALCPRWTVDGEDTYGRSPGMDALPDTKQVQRLELRLAAQVDKLSDPTMKGPASMEGKGKPNTIPGAMVYVPERPGSEKFEPAYVPDYQAATVTEKAIERREARINRFFFVDFWLAMLGDDRATPATAEEIRAKKEERMLQLGPVLERTQVEYLAPSIDLVFEEMLEAGDFPPPPPELVKHLEAKGAASIVFDVEYVSIAAAAQKALGLTNVRSFLELVGQAGAIDAQAFDSVDVDAIVHSAAAMLGINPKIIKTMPVVKELRAAKAAAQQAADQGAAMGAGAKAIRDVASAPAPGPDNALGAMLATMGPQAAGLIPSPTNLM